ncbi:MAG: thioredoxin family protein [Marinifilaceae bacterium]|jgi:thioredoxin-like negative regulator of GroEL
MQILRLTELEKIKEEQSSFYIYFSTPNCGVCTVLKPKLMEMLTKEYPQLKSYTVDTAKTPEIAAQLGIYTNPSLLVFLEGQEILKRSRSIGVEEVRLALQRPYSLAFPSGE